MDKLEFQRRAGILKESVYHAPKQSERIYESVDALLEDAQLNELFNSHKSQVKRKINQNVQLNADDWKINPNFEQREQFAKQLNAFMASQLESGMSPKEAVKMVIKKSKTLSDNYEEKTGNSIITKWWLHAAIWTPILIDFLSTGSL